MVGITEARGAPGWLDDSKPADGAGQHERRIGANGGVILDADYRLPDNPRQKLQEMELQNMAEHGRVRALSDLVRARREIIAACMETRENLVGPTTHDRRDGRGMCLGLALDHPEVVQVGLQLKEAQESFEQANGAYNYAMESWKDGQRTVHALKGYVDRKLRSGKVIMRVGPVDITLRKGEEIYAAIERRRRRIRELHADAAAVHAAPIHSSRSKALALEQITQLADRGTPNVLALVETGAPIVWPEKEACPTLSQLAARQLTAPAEREFDALALFAYLHRSQLIASVNEEIDRLADDESALSAKERKERTQTIMRDILEVEFEEEALIVQAHEKSLNIPRRSDADPRAVLGLSAEMPAPDVLFR